MVYFKYLEYNWYSQLETPCCYCHYIISVEQSMPCHSCCSVQCAPLDSNNFQATLPTWSVHRGTQAQGQPGSGRLPTIFWSSTAAASLPHQSPNEPSRNSHLLFLASTESPSRQVTGTEFHLQSSSRVPPKCPSGARRRRLSSSRKVCYPTAATAAAPVARKPG